MIHTPSEVIASVDLLIAKRGRSSGKQESKGIRKGSQRDKKSRKGSRKVSGRDSNEPSLKFSLDVAQKFKTLKRALAIQGAHCACIKTLDRHEVPASCPACAVCHISGNA